MGFKDFIFSFFPSGWLNPSADGNKRFFGGLGKSIDYVYDLAHQVELESSVSTTAVFTLSDREIECGIAPDPSLDVEFRRARLLARMQEEAGPVNTEDFEKALGLLSNSKARIIPDHPNYSVTYHLEFSKSLTLNLLLLEEYIRRNKLAHLAHSYQIAPTTSSVQFFMAEKTTVYVSTYQECGTFVAGGEWSLA